MLLGDPQPLGNLSHWINALTSWTCHGIIVKYVTWFLSKPSGWLRPSTSLMIPLLVFLFSFSMSLMCVSQDLLTHKICIQALSSVSALRGIQTKSKSYIHITLVPLTLITDTPWYIPTLMQRELREIKPTRPRQREMNVTCTHSTAYFLFLWHSSTLYFSLVICVIMCLMLVFPLDFGGWVFLVHYNVFVCVCMCPKTHNCQIVGRCSLNILK